MKILWENSDYPGSRIESTITNLSWIVQADKPGHGLLGVGSDTGSVGITMTDLYPTEDDYQRYNFNLRGHHAGIAMVTWNKPLCKLASCDVNGVIYVWVRNEDRWSVELVNDRGVKVRDLCWSPCGSSALICYEDNFVLIGSSTGQRVWSNSFPNTNMVMCGCWAADSRNLILGFANGAIQVLSDQGANITERSYTREGLSKMTCSSENDGKWTLAMLTAKNEILMLDNFDQVVPYEYQCPCDVVQMEWNSNGKILAVLTSEGELLMLDVMARPVHRDSSFHKGKPPTALTWIHDGKALIVACGGQLSVGRISPGVPTLFNLVTYEVWKSMGASSRMAYKLPIPLKEKDALKALDHHIIRCRIPREENLCKFVCSVTDARCYCTIRPVAKGSHSFVLCMEHLGGLVPLLVGRQVNRVLPQFHVSVYTSASITPPPLAGSSAQVEDASIPSRGSTGGRNSFWRRSKRQIRALMSRHVRPPRTDVRLAQVTSNIWCTRFNITSMNTKLLPEFLGQVVYKTSVLHLQPRQMTIDLTLLDPMESSTPNVALLQQNSVCTTPSSRDSECDEMSNLLKSTIIRDDDGLTTEERAFFEKVVNECIVLRSAMLASSSEPPAGQGTSQVAASKETTRTESRQDDSDMKLSTTSTWQDEIESLEFIDGPEEAALLPSTSSLAPTASIDEEEPVSDKMKTELQTDLDRLVRIAGQLSHRQNFNFKRDKASINRMRLQMKELLRKVHEIEKKVGNDDVRTEVRQLMRTLKEIKNALGEGKLIIPPYSRVLTMHNKTPFWNEHNQVYQLDFGGRVTQESAKNFQIEMDDKQVLQFGRIDHDAYTLDFRSPLSASQAFSIALASITQRLK